MKNVFSAFLMVTILLLSACNKNKVTKIPLPDGFIENDWNQVLAAANDNDRKIFVHFYADWCSACADFKEDVLNEAEVEAYIQDNFIGAILDAENEPGQAIYEGFNLTGHPNLAVVDKEGNLIAQHLGKMDKAQFLTWIRNYD